MPSSAVRYPLAPEAARRGAPDLLRVLWERKLLLAATIVVCVASAFIVSSSADEQYTAESELLLRDPGFARTLFGSDLFEGSVDPDREASTKIAVIESTAVSSRVSARLAGSVPPTDLQEVVSVSPNENSDVVTVTATSKQAAAAATIANTYAAEYVAYQRDLDRAKVQDAQRLVQQNLDSLPADSTSQRDGLLDSLKQLKVLEALQTGNADLVARASVPNSPSSPKPLRDAFLAGLVGLLLGVGAALLADFLDRRLRTSEDIEQAFGATVLVSIPRGVPRPGESDVVGIKAEPYRMLRENLRFLEVGGPLRTLLITSADPAEGKTTVAVNLARALVAGGDRVVLIDADLRRPTAGRQLGVETQGPGLSTALVARRSIHDLLRDIPPDGVLRLLPSGPLPPNPADLLRIPHMQQILEEAREEAAVVIIDAAPLLPVSDTRALLDLPNVDGVLVVARALVTRRDRAAAARRVLAQSEQKVLGVVLNGVRYAGSDYRYYGQYAVNGAEAGRDKADATVPDTGDRAGE